MLYVYAGISSHQVPKAMQLAGLLWNGITDDIPSHVTVLDWVEKCGLSLTRGCMREKAAEEAYSLIFDNSITVWDRTFIYSSGHLPSILAIVSGKPT